MESSNAQETEILSCTCCGKGIRDNAQENVSYGERLYSHDNGIGLCRECGGDDRVKAKPGKQLSEKAVRKRMGWASEMFFDARIEMLRKNLSAANVEKFEKMSYGQKCLIVSKMVEKGVIV